MRAGWQPAETPPGVVGSQKEYESRPGGYEGRKGNEMEIKTRVMKGMKQTPKYMFERMVQTAVAEQTGAQVYASGIEYNEDCDMWFFRCEAIGDDGDGNKAFLTCDGYIGTLGRVVITDTKYLRVEVA